MSEPTRIYRAVRRYSLREPPKRRPPRYVLLHLACGHTKYFHQMARGPLSRIPPKVSCRECGFALDRAHEILIKERKD